jgi:hypothetical protein
VDCLGTYLNIGHFLEIELKNAASDKAAGNQFYQESARAKAENGNSFVVLSRMATLRWVDGSEKRCIVHASRFMIDVLLS